MAAPYPGTPVNGYDASPPPDDGSTTAPNQITWAGIKSKIGDPLDNFAIAVDSNITAAFGKTLDGAGTVNAGTNYPMTAADQGRLIKGTVAGVVITTPDATSVGAPFVFAVNNQSTGGIGVDGFGTQTVDGAAAGVLIPPGAGAIFKTDGTNWFSFGTSVATGIQPQGYLTLSSDPNAPILVADAINVSTVYYTPDTGNILPIFNGTTFVAAGFAQLPLALVSQHLAFTIYDVFGFNNAGATTLGTGPAWVNSAANAGNRGTGAGSTQLVKIGGIWVNGATGGITLRNGANTYNVGTNLATYLGSILISNSAGFMSFTISYGQNRTGSVWNAYNRKPINIICGDTTATWSYNNGAARAANNSTNNNLIYLLGLPEEQVDLTYRIRANIATGANTGAAITAIGVGSGTAQTGTQGYFQVATASSTLGGEPLAIYNPPPVIGIQQIFASEQGDGGGGTVTWHGTSTWMLLKASYNG